jgi:drug/metabolite transporter (DMT)-like permease
MQYIKNLGSVQIAVLFLIIANIIWGAGFPIYKWSLEELPPFTFAFIRFFFGALIILPFVINNLKVSREDYRNLIIASIVSVSIQIPLLFFGLKLAPSINAPIIIAMGPIFLIVASFIFLKEKIRAKTVGGTLISLLGVTVIMIEPLLISGISGSFMGNFFIFMATICSVIQAILLKTLTVRNDVMVIFFWIFLLGSLPLIPLVIYESTTFSIASDLTIKGLVGILYGIYFTAILAHYFYTYGVSKIKASEVGIFSYVDPIAAIIIAVPLLGETITAYYIAGALLVFLGIFIAEGRFHYHPFRKLFARN